MVDMIRTTGEEITDALEEAINMNMGNNVPVMTILETASRLAHVPIDWVEQVYYEKLDYKVMK